MVPARPLSFARFLACAAPGAMPRRKRLRKLSSSSEEAAPETSVEEAAAAAAAALVLSAADEEERQEENLRRLIASLLTQKERLTDGLVSLLTSEGRREESLFGFYDGVSEDDKQVLVDAAKEKLGALSPVICNKLLPLVVKQLVDEHERRVSASFARVRVPKSPTASMARMYRAAFTQWTESPHVSYVAGNRIQLGSLSPKECFVLHVFSFMGCFRAKPDDLFAVCLTGETSVGKSLIFENPFSANAHQFLNQEGVGRWQTGQHSLVLYHDINLSVLLRPSECETFKTLARTEMSSAKIVGSAAYLKPLFVCVTSNQRVHTHSIENPTRELRDRVKSEEEDVWVTGGGSGGGGGVKGGKKPRSLSRSAGGGEGQMLLPAAWNSGSSSTAGVCRRILVLKSQLRSSNSLDTPNIRALKSRVIEAHCFQRPELEAWCLPRGEKFTRAHLLLGVYETALSILEGHERRDFYSWVLPSYVLATLCMVSRFHSRQLESGDGEGQTRRRLLAVLERLEPDEREREFFVDLLGPTPLPQTATTMPTKVKEEK